jgi:glycosyltransferase involved in cell wall biosynthesis
MSGSAKQADVGAVIPSRGRRDLLHRALDSVSAQTVQPAQVVVVLDGADPQLEQELNERSAPKVHVLVIDPPRGPAHARNTGVATLETTYVAFLDDDDEWLPRKLERQLALLEHGDLSYTRVLAQGPGRAVVWPRRAPGSEPPSEYLFDRRRPWSGAGLLLNSTIAARTELAARVRFDESLRQHEDWDWALRAVEAGRLVFCDEVLGIWHVDRTHRRRSHGHDWRYSLEWARSHRHLFTPRAYSAFLLVNAFAIALQAHDRRAARVLAREAREHGAPSWSQWAIFATLTVVSPARVERLREAVRGTGAQLGYPEHYVAGTGSPAATVTGSPTATRPGTTTEQ